MQEAIKISGKVKEKKKKKKKKKKRHLKTLALLQSPKSG
jgi:hypothetical protein